VPFFRDVMGLAIPNAAMLLTVAGMLAAAVAWLELLRRSMRTSARVPR